LITELLAKPIAVTCETSLAAVLLLMPPLPAHAPALKPLATSAWTAASD
jgi:hypothetical protein